MNLDACPRKFCLLKVSWGKAPSCCPDTGQACGVARKPRVGRNVFSIKSLWLKMRVSDLVISMLTRTHLAGWVISGVQDIRDVCIPRVLDVPTVFHWDRHVCMQETSHGNLSQDDMHYITFVIIYWLYDSALNWRTLPRTKTEPRHPTPSARPSKQPHYRAISSWFQHRCKQTNGKPWWIPSISQQQHTTNINKQYNKYVLMMHKPYYDCNVWQQKQLGCVWVCVIWGGARSSHVSHTSQTDQHRILTHMKIWYQKKHFQTEAETFALAATYIQSLRSLSLRSSKPEHPHHITAQ